MALLRRVAATAITVSSLLLVQSNHGFGLSALENYSSESTSLMQEVSKAVSRTTEESEKSLGRKDLEEKILHTLNNSIASTQQYNADPLSHTGVHKALCGTTRIVPSTNLTLCHTNRENFMHSDKSYFNSADYFITVMESEGLVKIIQESNRKKQEIYRQPITIIIYDNKGDGISPGDFVYATWHNNAILNSTTMPVNYTLNYSSQASENWSIADCKGQNMVIKQGSLSLIKTASTFSTIIKVITLSAVDLKQKKIDELNLNYASLISQDSPPGLSGAMAVKSLALAYDKIADLYDDRSALARMRSCK